jgi:hypothetical protein
MVIRGMFGISPDIPKNTFYITPAFPSDWKKASIRTPMISYQYSRAGNRCSVTVLTPEPTLKIIRPYPGAAETIRTKRERKSVVEFTLPDIKHLTAEENSAPQVLAEKNPRKGLTALSADELSRTVMLDLSEVYNTTLKKMTTETSFMTDYGTPTTITGWWHTPPGATGAGDEVVVGADGVKFLVKGRNDAAEGKGGNIIAVSSWGRCDGGYSLPGAVTIPINRKIRKSWLLLQSYVSPLKNYIPNGEVVLNYSDKTKQIIQLIPPYNLDIYYQPFARDGAAVELGKAQVKSAGWDPCYTELNRANALELPIECDGTKVLNSIEIRGTCSEGVIGIAAVTLLPAE